MTPYSLGLIAVPKPGTPVRVTEDASIVACRIRFSVIQCNLGRTFLGVAGMVKETHVGVLKEYWPTNSAAAIPDSLEIQATVEEGKNPLRLADYYVDANTATEGLIVAYWKRG